MNRKPRILVVDDESQQRKGIFEKFLPSDKFETTYPNDESQFLACEISTFDVVILDINLVGWDTRTTTALRKIDGRAPLILATSQINNQATIARIQEAFEAVALQNVAHLFDLSIFANPDLDEQYVEEMANVYQSLVNLTVSISNRSNERDHQFSDDEEINILHISDPQYGDAKTDDWSKFIEQNLASTILKHHSKIDFIAITGDIAFSGKSEEYAKAKIGVEKLLKKLIFKPDNIARKRLLIVPGNHDVDLRFSSVPDIRISRDDKEYVLEIPRIQSSPKPNSTYGMIPFRRFAHTITGDDRWLTSDDLSWINDHYLANGIRFLLLNSAGYISHAFPKICKINQGALDMLDSQTSEHSNDVFTIMLSHHGLTDPAPSSDYVIEDLNEDWPSLSNFMNNFSVKLWLHGHGHKRITNIIPFKKYDKELIAQQKLKTSEGINHVKSDSFIRVMAPTSHLCELAREGKRGFAVITLIRKNSKVRFLKIAHYHIDDESSEIDFSDELVHEFKFN